MHVKNLKLKLKNSNDLKIRECIKNQHHYY